ncbi:TetR/AcrR family transcriptional regulator [Polyangium aurulentum]|uniref:TetR/AcrR family transcriptional regulator n=1 Tax=Polyangium aurulentum TaxID=2567896 RepID=UPI00146EED3B|nr:TetR/AcrR family transcriptional regulator [Polyangium aurulentum]UQA57184.1 TetR/AcrR family transcriptional regulator [Polyangium aurulentum]
MDERRQQLLELGMRAFSERPYDAVSIDEIAAEAGISRGLLFHYFRTKHDYYVAVQRVAAEQLVREAFALEEGSPHERLVAGLHAYFRFVEQRAEAYATLLRAGVGSDPVVNDIVESTRQEFIERIRGQLDPALREGPSARLVRAGLRGFIGTVEALALDWIEHRDLTRDELVSLAVRAMVLAVPQAAGEL